MINSTPYGGDVGGTDVSSAAVAERVSIGVGIGEVVTLHGVAADLSAVTDEVCFLRGLGSLRLMAGRRYVR